MKRFESEQVIPREPGHCFAVVTAPESLPKWFKGAHDVQVANGYPAVGGTMEWAVGKGDRWRFRATVVTDARPGSLVTRVRTPSGESIITQRFDAVAGGTRYRKTVEFSGGALSRLFVGFFLPGAVRREVERAAALAMAA